MNAQPEARKFAQPVSGPLHWDDVPMYSDKPLRETIAKARPEGRAAVITFITDKRNEYADHARQARALPRTAETLALRAETLSEVLGLLDGAP